MVYPIVEIDTDTPVQLEQLGTKAKFWYRDRAGQRVLFKEGRPGTGENWAEKVCCEICAKLGIPHVEYELAIWANRKGVITPSCVPDSGRLILGNELLARIVDDYDKTARFRARQHTVRTVMAVVSVKPVGMPKGWQAPDGISDAAGVFVGYLMLDALVSNQDRHHENWGLILISDEGIFLAPTFDHASSLGRNEADQTRTERLTTNDHGRTVEAYVARAKSAFFDTQSRPKALTTLEAFQEGAKLRPQAAEYWLGRLSGLRQSDFTTILGNIPPSEASIPAREFAGRMLEANTKRLLQKDDIEA